MATFSAQIQDLVGSFSDETAMDQWLEDGAKEIINILPEDLQKLCASMQSFTSVAAGSEDQTMNTGKVFSVFAGSVDCREIDSIFKYRAEDSGRVDYATSTDPVYYVESNFINVLPTSLSCKYEEVQYPSSIDADSDSAISSFPDEAEYLVVLYASIKALQQQMNTKQGDLPADVVVPVLETISESLPTWSAPSDFVVPIKPAVPTISSQVIADPSSFAPNYTKPVLSLGTTPTISDLDITAVPPDVPSLSSITYSSIDSAVDASLTTMDTITIGSVLGSSTLPAYTKLTSTVVSGVTAFSGYTSGLSETDPGVLSITAVLPVSPSTPNFTTPAIDSTLVGFTTLNNLGDTPTYIKPNITARVSFDTFYEDTSNSNPFGTSSDPGAISITAVPPDIPSLSSTSLSFGTAAPTYDETIGDTEIGEASTAIDNEDIELASARLQESQVLMQQELNQFNEENIEYQAQLQISIQNAQFDNQEDARLIQKYQTEISEYQAEVNTQVQEHSQKQTRYQLEVNTVYTTWAKTESDSLQQYSSDIQNELNEYNKENAVYQTKLNEAIQQAQINANKAQQQAQLDATETQQEASLLLQKENQEYSSKLQKYQAEVRKYSEDVNKQVQEYGQKLSQYQLELNVKYQAWAKTESDRIIAIQTDMSDELNDFNKDNALYQARIQETMAEFQQTNQMNISNAERSQSRQLQNSVNDMKIIFDNNAQKIQKYQVEIAEYQAEVNTQVQEYQQNLNGDIQVWQAERSTDLQKYGSDIQNELNEFNKENAKYQAIIQEYIQEAQLLDAHEARKLQKYQSEVGTYSAELNTNIQKFTQELTKNKAAFDTSLQKYTSEVQKVNVANQSKIQIYTGEVSNFTQIVQKQTVDYQWLQSQYVQLKADYQQGLQLLSGRGSPQPAQQQQGR